MTDPLQQLRDANPVPNPVSYTETELRARVADAMDPIGDAASTTSGARRRYAPLLVAAVVAVLAVVTAVVVHGRTGRSNPDAAGAHAVTCAVDAGGGKVAVADRLTRARTVIDTRLHALGGSAIHVHPDRTAATIDFDPHGVTAAVAVKACRATSTSIRPLVAAPVAQVGSPTSADPLHGLGFPVPRTNAELARLAPVQRANLTAAMSHYDCAAGQAAPDSAATLVCLREGRTSVLLLGPALAGSSDVTSADAVGPNAGGGAVQWTAQLGLDAAAARRFGVFTAAYNAGGATDATVATCGPGTLPCADFVAFTVDGSVVWLPLTGQPITGGEVQVAGGFTERSARAVAADYTAAAVGLRTG